MFIMSQIYNLHYFESENKDVLHVILNGFSDTCDSQFITTLFDHCQDNNQSVLSFDYEFQHLKQDASSWPELEVETAQLDMVIKQYAWAYKKINFIAKSLGAIVLSKYLGKHTINQDFSVKTLGYIHDEIEMGSYIARVSIVQWENDKFWSPADNQTKISEKYHTSVPMLTVAWWDHSYRNADKTGLVWLDQIKAFILS